MQDFSFVRIEEVTAKWKWLEQTSLTSQTNELRSLGFVWGGDYDVQNSVREEFLAPKMEEPDDSAFVEAPPLASPYFAPKTKKSKTDIAQVEVSHQHYFVRLLVHPQERCYAELVSICIRIGADIPLKIQPLQTTVTSLWSDGEQDISYGTTDGAPSFFAEVGKKTTDCGRADVVLARRNLWLCTFAAAPNSPRKLSCRCVLLIQASGSGFKNAISLFCVKVGHSCPNAPALLLVESGRFLFRLKAVRTSSGWASSHRLPLRCDKKRNQRASKSECLFS